MTVLSGIGLWYVLGILGSGLLLLRHYLNDTLDLTDATDANSVLAGLVVVHGGPLTLFWGMILLMANGLEWITNKVLIKLDSIIPKKGK